MAPVLKQVFQLALLRHPGIYKPFLIGISLMAFQQLSGINAVMFYAETIFEEAKFKVRSLCLTCFIQMPHGWGCLLKPRASSPGTGLEREVPISGWHTDQPRPPFPPGQQPGLSHHGHHPGAVHSRGSPHHGQSWAEATPGLVR